MDTSLKRSIRNIECISCGVCAEKEDVYNVCHITPFPVCNSAAQAKGGKTLFPLMFRSISLSHRPLSIFFFAKSPTTHSLLLASSLVFALEEPLVHPFSRSTSSLPVFLFPFYLHPDLFHPTSFPLPFSAPGTSSFSSPSVPWAAHFLSPQKPIASSIGR